MFSGTRNGTRMVLGVYIGDRTRGEGIFSLICFLAFGGSQTGLGNIGLLLPGGYCLRRAVSEARVPIGRRRIKLMLMGFVLLLILYFATISKSNDDHVITLYSSLSKSGICLII